MAEFGRMALVGKRTALISVGMSCQTVRQLHNAVDLARQITGDKTLTKKSLPFDWLICPPRSAAEMLRDRRFFPTSPDELKAYPLEVVNGRAPNIPGWQQRNTFFWHEFTAPDATIANGFREVARKFEYLAASFRALRGKRIFAFVSNTQCNFDMIERVTGVGPQMLASDLNALKYALDAELGRVPLCVVHSGLAMDEPPRFSAFKITQTVDHWAGEESAWQPAIAEFLQSELKTRRT
jgi:hypothetical protein